jgi:hypothetical protein
MNASRPEPHHPQEPAATGPAPEPPRPAPEPARPATFLQTAGTVFWSFFGVRKRRHFESDTRLNPVHVIVMGLIGAAVFVGTLLAIVSLILRAR